MTPLSTILMRMALNRKQTMAFVAYLELLARQEAKERGTDPEREAARILAADPTDGRLGPIGWHLLHIGLYEETAFGPSPHAELWSRYERGFRAGKSARSLETIAKTLEATRAHFTSLAERWSDDTLDRPLPRPSPDGSTYRELLESIVWHEPHHLNTCNENLRRQYVTEPER